ncbi:MAG TPA: hypothetical protein VIH35_08475, partial [Kiritimatiellia bacterium]
MALASAAATYRDNYYLQNDGNDGPTSTITTNGNGQIWYQWRKTDYSGSGTTWMKFEWSSFAYQLGASASGGANVGMTNNTRFHAGVRFKNSGEGCSDPGDITVGDMQTTNTYVYNVLDTTFELTDSCTDDQAAFVAHEVNHKNALVTLSSTAQVSNDLTYAYLDSRSSAESANSSEELWFMYTTNGWTDRTYIEVTGITAAYALPLRIGVDVNFGANIQWVVETSSDVTTTLVQNTTHGMLNYDVMPIERRGGQPLTVLRTLLKNPSFEIPPTVNPPNEGHYNWKASDPDAHGAFSNAVSRENWRYHSGSWMAAVKGTWGGSGSDRAIWQEVTNTFDAGDVWEAGAWFWNDATYANTSSKLKLLFIDGSGNVIGGHTNTFSPPGETWTYVSVLATSVASTVWVRFMLDVVGVNANGALQLDDAILYPVESSVKVTNMVINAGATVYDSTITSGSYNVQMFLRSGDGVESTNAAGQFLQPNFDILNGAALINNEVFGSFAYEDGGRTLNAQDGTHAAVQASAVTIGTYTGRVSMISSNLLKATDTNRLISGSLMTFEVVDDDTNAPVLSLSAVTNSQNLFIDGGVATNTYYGTGGSQWRHYDAANINDWADRNFPAGYGMAWESWADGAFGGFGQEVAVNMSNGNVFTFHIYGNSENCFSSTVQEAWMKIEFLNNAGTELGESSNSVYNTLVSNRNTWVLFTLGATNFASGVTTAKVTVGFGNASDDGGCGNYAVKWDDAALIQGHQFQVFIGTTNMTSYDGRTNGLHVLTDAQLAQVSNNSPLKLVFGAYDAGSGLSRGQESSTTQMNVDVGAWLTDNVTNYISTNSSAYASTFGPAQGTSTWLFQNVDISALIFQTNAVQSSLKDFDADRPNDQATKTNSLYGYLVVN